jgi:hypothetical protein
MRSAPFAFWPQLDRSHPRDRCRLTHHHDEAYVGALAIVLASRAVHNGQWTGAESLLALSVPQLPDTRVRDRLLAIQAVPGPPTIAEVARLGNGGLRCRLRSLRPLLRGASPTARIHAGVVREDDRGRRYGYQGLVSRPSGQRLTRPGAVAAGLTAPTSPSAWLCRAAMSGAACARATGVTTVFYMLCSVICSMLNTYG